MLTMVLPQRQKGATLQCIMFLERVPNQLRYNTPNDLTFLAEI